MTFEGTRMGVSEHIDDSHRVFSFKLDDEDRARIEEVLAQSRESKLIDFIGDCGAEYRGK